MVAVEVKVVELINAALAIVNYSRRRDVELRFSMIK